MTMGKPTRALITAAALLALAACGGSKDEGPPADLPASRAEAARFLTQASFGPTAAEVDRVMALGYRGWIDDQLARPASSNRAFWETQDAAVKAADPTNTSATIGQDGVYNAFWRHAVSGDDQLRQRMAYALSQIFVISLQDGNVGNEPRAVAHYLDMLGDKGLANYRELIEAVSLHPMMGTYLTSIRNRKADPRTGRVPDENYAREVMQLFSIGLVELNDDGSVKQAGGVPKETYGPADIAGLAKVFTGWSWACADLSNTCFGSGALGGVSDPERSTKPMVGYPQYHAMEEKSFLGTTIAAQGTADPNASLKTALDTLYNHANVGPFIGRQLIQRFVTSNPSPAYVAAVAGAFNNNGAGVRGDMKAVLKAVLLNPEARTTSDRSGKIREPVLRLSALLRGFGYASDSGRYRVGNTDNAGSSLGQTAMRSPSVFNFYPPDYPVPGKPGMVGPQFGIHNANAALERLNFLTYLLYWGGSDPAAGVPGAFGTRIDTTPFEADAADAAKLVDRLSVLATGAALPTGTRGRIVSAVEAFASSNSANWQSERARQAAYLVFATPAFQVQR
ncbi:DUF1800 family protein [Piscinibacter sp.]|uniref:DUF1800 family protein n=1 Tax=Piscinibacter sp. TaxID=1903157 RepID=UPI003784FBEE